MSELAVEEIRVGGLDAAGQSIEVVYARAKPRYAIYRTKDRVMVHYADEGADQPGFALRRAQQAGLARLNPVRGAINSLIDGWRSSDNPRLRTKAARYDRRIADALVAGLEGDCECAEKLLEAIRQDILDERISWARFLYLIVASAAVVLVLLIVCLVTTEWYARAFNFSISPEYRGVWMAAAAGAVGAFFSTAIGIRGRTILPDLRWRNNAADATLRIVIGLIGATVLILLMRAHMIGEVSVNGASVIHGATFSLPMVLAIGFIAGFLERLVPDLLAKTAVTSELPASTAQPAPRAEPRASSPPPQAAQGPGAGVAPPGPEPTGVESVEGAVDGCVSQIPLEDSQVTMDAELPAASGGVTAEAR